MHEKKKKQTRHRWDAEQNQGDTDVALTEREGSVSCNVGFVTSKRMQNTLRQSGGGKESDKLGPTCRCVRAPLPVGALELLTQAAFWSTSM